VRIVNLETSITCSEHPWPDKEVHYRMHPGNVGCLTAAHIDCCCLANNHVLDWGYPGLQETLQTLDGAGVAHAGAGCDAAEAMAPATIEVAQKSRVLVFAFGTSDSGVYRAWGAGQDRAGVNLLPDFSKQTARQVTSHVLAHKRPGDVAVVSIHWGSNWGYDVTSEHVAFAHSLVDAGVDVVHGHSTHHVRPIEANRDRLILYGCDDSLTDYEGIRGHEAYRGDLALMFLVTFDLRRGRLIGVRLVPMQAWQLRLRRAPRADALWLRDLLNRLGAPFGTHVEVNGDNGLEHCWS
jgi:poly-gamma-glutamate synthesis protein (capsule biosynthesis protein)